MKLHSSLALSFLCLSFATVTGANDEPSGLSMLTAPSLVETCENGDSTQTEICTFYLAGVLDHSKQFGDGRFDVCAPSGATNASLRDAFLQEIERTGRFIPDDMAAAPYVVTMFVHRGWTC